MEAVGTDVAGLGQEGADPRTSRNFYKAVLQVTLLLGTESWVVSPFILRILGGFHHRVSRRLTNMQLKRDVMGRWIYLPLDAATKSVGMEEVEMYVFRRHNTAT